MFCVPFDNMGTSSLLVKDCKILRLYSALMVFEQGGVFIVPHLLEETGPRFTRSHPKVYLFSRILRYTRGTKDRVPTEFSSITLVCACTTRYIYMYTIGLLNWYWWKSARFGCKDAGLCECISKPTSANIHISVQ